MSTVDLPIPIVVTRHQCPYCRRTHSKKAAAIAHIARCWQNPAARGCKTCGNFEPSEPGPYPEHPGWPEKCYAGRDITSGLVSGCSQWTPDSGDEADDSCRLVEVDGETIRVRGASDMTEQEQGYLADIVRAAKRRFESDHAAPAGGEEQR